MSKDTESPSETTSAAPVEALRSAMRIISAEILDAEASKKGSRKRAHVPRLAAQAVMLFAELRKAEKAQAQAAAELSHGLVLSWAKQQTREVRARLLRDLEAIDNPHRRSVLG